MNRLARTSLLLTALALPVLPLAAQPASHDHHAAHHSADPIDTAIQSSTRTPANVARDIYRHPAETLRYFGVTPTQTVVEFSPGGGWYTEILAPLLKDKGHYYAAQAPGKGFDKLHAKLDADSPLYGKATLVPWTVPTTGIAAGSVDTVLTFRNVHNLVMDGTEAATFKAFFDMLKPGGTLGVVDHRLPENRDIALEKSSGYLKVSTIRRIAAAAGFDYVGASEVNANPKDSADWANGVWTLPPVLANGDVDRAKYLAIGESDRMTLKFRKPGK